MVNLTYLSTAKQVLNNRIYTLTIPAAFVYNLVVLNKYSPEKSVSYRKIRQEGRFKMSNNYQVNRQDDAFDKDELTDQDLEQVAGGFTPVPIPDARVSQLKPVLTQAKITSNLLQGIVQGTNQILR